MQTAVQQRRSRVVRPDTATLKISDGDWLLVRKRLNHGERSDSYRQMYVDDGNGGVRVDPLMASMAMVTAYLIDWSLVYEDGSPIVIKGRPLDEIVGALRSIDGDDFLEIKTAIEAHEAAMTAEREAEKNGQGGGNLSSAILPSPSL